MDYPNRRRLKVWARARIVHRSEDPELLDRLEVPTYRARVERAVVLTVEALDWNCPQHITPRFTESEVEEMVRPLTDRIAELEAAAPDALPVASGRQTALGDGPLDLVVTGIRQLTPEVRAYEFRRPDFGNLPAAGAGSHILVPVPSQNGRQESRAYSITSDPGRRDAYEIAVRLDPDGRGGSRAIHAGYALGTRLRASRPRNTFALHRDDRPAVLIAGGIGITPLKAMAQALQADGRRFHLHDAARSRALMAYRPELAGALEDAVSFHDTAADQRLDIEAVLSDAALEAVIYVCGPPRLIDAVRGTAFALGIAPARVVHESFGAAPNPDTDTAFEVRLERSGTTLQVAADETILDTLIDAGVATDFECRSGTCGTCAIKVLEGEPLHRDSALTDAERDQAGLICTCVSRAASDRLMLDL